MLNSSCTFVVKLQGIHKAMTTCIFSEWYDKCKSSEKINNTTASIKPLEKIAWLSCLIIIIIYYFNRAAVRHALLIVSTLPFIMCTFSVFRILSKCSHDPLWKMHKKDCTEG